jgi:hypothetical protein
MLVLCSILTISMCVIHIMLNLNEYIICADVIILILLVPTILVCFRCRRINILLAANICLWYVIQNLHVSILCISLLCDNINFIFKKKKLRCLYIYSWDKQPFVIMIAIQSLLVGCSVILLLHLFVTILIETPVYFSIYKTNWIAFSCQSDFCG